MMFISRHFLPSRFNTKLLISPNIHLSIFPTVKMYERSPTTPGVPKNTRQV
jgi:hypothetical protein